MRLLELIQLTLLDTKACSIRGYLRLSTGFILGTSLPSSHVN
jgi:hypothetical protein